MASSSSETSVDVNSSIEKPGPPVSASVVAVEKRGYFQVARLAASSKVWREIADCFAVRAVNGGAGKGSDMERMTAVEGPASQMGTSLSQGLAGIKVMALAATSGVGLETMLNSFWSLQERSYPIKQD